MFTTLYFEYTFKLNEYKNSSVDVRLSVRPSVGLMENQT